MGSCTVVAAYYRSKWIYPGDGVIVEYLEFVSPLLCNKVEDDGTTN